MKIKKAIVLQLLFSSLSDKSTSVPALQFRAVQALWIELSGWKDTDSGERSSGYFARLVGQDILCKND